MTAGTTAGGASVALAVGDSAAGEVVGADLHKNLVTSEQFDPELGELSSGSAETLVTSRLLEGDQIEPVSLFLLDHARGFDHALVASSVLLESV
jgi:hypothetical protein